MKVSLNDAKRRSMPNTSSPSRPSWGPFSSSSTSISVTSSSALALGIVCRADLCWEQRQGPGVMSGTPVAASSSSPVTDVAWG
jgi:hypothetical protein